MRASVPAAFVGYNFTLDGGHKIFALRHQPVRRRRPIRKLNMPNTGHTWSEGEKKDLMEAWGKRILSESKKNFCREYAEKNGFTFSAVESQLARIKLMGGDDSVQESTYPVYDEPLRMEGDALIISDIEFPFHHADFINRCLDLAQKWKIDQAILAGDVLHFDGLSGWEPNWTKEKQAGLDDAGEKKLVDFAMSLPKKYQGDALDLAVSLGRQEEQDGISTELKIARQGLSAFESIFKRIDFIIGNHEGRLLRTMQTVLSPNDLMRLLGINEGNPIWRIAPYYYSILISGGEKFSIEHPKNSRKYSASQLCSKYLSHIIMGHSHQFNVTFDVSGHFYALEIGHGVDETRLPYASQRHNPSPAHILGACIVRDGIPWPLHKLTDFNTLAKIKW